jgi:predicted AAA+ superfamily ATPase
VTHNTARAWISVLQASHLVHLLQPHHSNFRKRLVKTPKLYFTDPGLTCSLLGAQSAAQIATHPHRGAIFETWVFGELLKARYNRGLRSNLNFWRDRAGLEVDFLVDDGERLCPVEAKSGATVTQDPFEALEAWRKLAGKAAGQATLLHGGADRHARRGVSVLPWTALGEEPLPIPGLA